VNNPVNNSASNHQAKLNTQRNMTTIKNISGKNVKGRTFDHQLGPVTVFVGPNTAGKTAIADAIRVGLTGQHGKLGKRDVTLLAGAANLMHIRVGFANGNESVHDWNHKSGSWSYKGKLAVGLPVPNVLLDASSYFALTADERIKFVFRLIPSDKVAVTVDDVLAALNRLPAETPRVVEARRELEKAIEKEFGPQPLADALDKSVALCKKAKADADAVAKQMTSSILAQTQMQATEGLVVARNVDTDLERVRGLIGELHGRLTTQRSAAESAAKASHRLDQLDMSIIEAQAESAKETELEALVAELRAKLDTMPDGVLESASVALAGARGELARIRQTLADKESELKTATQRAEEAKDKAARHKQLTAELLALDDQLADARVKLLATTKDCNKADAAVVDARGVVNTTASNIRHATADAEATDRRMAELASHPTCPWCEASEPGWKDKVVAKLATLLDFQKSTLTDALAAGRIANEQLAAASLEADAANNRLVIGRGAVEKMERSAGAMEAELRGLATTVREKTPEELAEMADAVAALKACLPGLESAVEKAFQRHEEAREATNERLALRQTVAAKEMLLAGARGFKSRLAVLLAEQETLRKVPSGDEEQIAETAEALEKLKAEEAELTNATKRAAAAAQDKLRREQARSEADDVKAVADFCKEAAATLVDIQATAIARAFDAVLSDAQRITEGILGSPLTYRDGEIGRLEGGAFISHRTFSGMEERLAYAALQVALAGPEAALKLVMIDELGTLDAANKHKLIERMLALTKEGLVGQFIGFDVADLDYVEHARNGLQVVAVAGK